jgi:hypothetical protein
VGTRGPKPKADVVCPEPKHADAVVVSRGRRITAKGTRRRYTSRPKVGREHSFSLIDAAVPMPVHSPPPPCPEHPGGKVVRDGSYGDPSTVKPRQVYRCVPDDGSPAHRFAPPLARDHVHTGKDSCAECEELRGTHRGDRTVARRHSWSARLVAETLKDLSEGKSYAAASREARRVTGRTRTRKPNAGATRAPAPADAKAKSAGSVQSANAWHTAADWVEAFSPVLWDNLEPRMRAADLVDRGRSDTEAADGEPLSQPMVLLLDEIPVEIRRRKSYYVLAAAQIEWVSLRPGDPESPKTARQVRFRLLRAYPTNDRYAWKLLLAELGYRPDFVVADRGTGLVRAVTETWGAQVPVLPSVFHMREAIERALLKTPGARRDAGTKKVRVGVARLLLKPLEEHLRELRRTSFTTMTAAEWTAWWDRLEQLLTSRGLPRERVQRLRPDYEPLVAALLPTYAAYPQLPLSTGGLEVALRQRVEPLLKGRKHAFANLERTNRLFDLVVVRDWTMFDDTVAVAELLRADGESVHGWATQLRYVQDVRATPKSRYSSLRDQQLLRERAREAGLS